VELLLAVVVGGLYAGGVYLMLRRSIIKLIFGLSLLGHAANLLIFTAAGLTRGRAPIVPRNGEVAVSQLADPLPQALILTAIVISFGVVAFALVLFRRGWQAAETDDTDALRVTES
jgi:multicomponent Na+:H+ antiporter subunit C